jgi:RHS repeat-associated protein
MRCAEDTYRFGFNGKENDNEIQGDGNSYDFGARIYDSRLGRWLSLDPMMKIYPSVSPYNFCANNPIIFIDPSGKTIIPAGKDEVDLINNMIQTYFGPNSGFEAKSDKVHFDKKMYRKFIRECDDKDMIQNAKRFKKIVTMKKYNTTVTKATQAEVKNNITEEVPGARVFNKETKTFEDAPSTFITTPIKTISTLSTLEGGSFFYAKEKNGDLATNSGVMINPDGQYVNKKGGGLTQTNQGATLFHELISHTYLAYKGDLVQKNNKNHNETDDAIQKENQYRSKANMKLRSGTDH